MRILVVGAGAIGGYFGGRLLAAGRDVTFLVRAARAAQLAAGGLAIRSPHGDLDLPAPPTAQADGLGQAFDLVLLSCKAYDLEGAMQSFAPAVGAATTILPLLNGIGHIETLERRFGAARTLGGLCQISSTLDAQGRVHHLNELHTLIFGERDGALSARAEAIQSAFANAGFDPRLSRRIVHDMWEKWVFIASAAGITCLMRAAIGDIAAAGGDALAMQLVGECVAVADRRGLAPSEAAMQRIRSMITAPGSTIMASMLRDIERGAPIEADAIISDLLRRGAAEGLDLPLLAIVATHLRAYQARRARENAGTS